MARGPRYSVKFRRRREGRTDYKKRIALLKSKKPRFAVRVSNKFVIAQLVRYQPAGDKTILSVNSNQLKKLGWTHSGKNLPAAYLTGLLAGKLALEAGVKEAVLDTGMKASTKGGKAYAVLKGAIDAGLQLPHSEENLPSEERIAGKHISEKVAADFVKAKDNVLKSKVKKATVGTEQKNKVPKAKKEAG